MQVIFMGTSEFAVPSLESLINSKKHEVLLVVTRPDSQAGRGLKITFPPVKSAAIKMGLEVFQPEKLNDNEIFEYISSKKADIIYCAAYGKFLPDRYLNLFPFGVINLHPSNLPEYRGAAPVQRALMDGRSETAITFIKMVKEMDAGDIIYKERVNIDPSETAGDLLIRLANLASHRLPVILEDFENGILKMEPQNHAKATFTKMIDKAEARIDWHRDARIIYNHWRGLTPEPGLFSFIDGKRIKIQMMRPTEDFIKIAGEPGEIIIEAGRIFVLCGDSNALEIMRLQPEGKKACEAYDFINGYKPYGKKFI